MIDIIIDKLSFTNVTGYGIADYLEKMLFAKTTLLFSNNEFGHNIGKTLEDDKNNASTSW
ncbi:7234_t:CDS:2 [Scutellospora calospora]|uniref:7234_t:CDS:1 n=1 Tax=Scutellospora calospora TaxID=85575 RepID=A0ACA9K4T6_9GLOM|nr:7234_t:CDS:2 [Scutellospora calospora]